MTTHFVLVDLENVQPKDVTALNAGGSKVMLFVGANQTKVSTDMAMHFQPFGPDVQYVRIEGNGNNALDFHIAFYIGRLSAETPDADFEIVSNDTGFDPLIKHLNQLRIACRRSRSIGEVPREAGVESVSESTDEAVAYLIKQKAARPRTLKTLRSALKAFFAKQLGEDAIERVIEQLTLRKVLKIADGKTHYQLPSEA